MNSHIHIQYSMFKTAFGLERLQVNNTARKFTKSVINKLIHKININNARGKTATVYLHLTTVFICEVDFQQVLDVNLCHVINNVPKKKIHIVFTLSLIFQRKTR